MSANQNHASIHTCCDWPRVLIGCNPPPTTVCDPSDTQAGTKLSLGKTMFIMLRWLWGHIEGYIPSIPLQAQEKASALHRTCSAAQVKYELSVVLSHLVFEGVCAYVTAFTRCLVVWWTVLSCYLLIYLLRGHRMCVINVSRFASLYTRHQYFKGFSYSND